MGEVEKWVPVLGYSGTLEVSDLGRIRSIDRTIVDTLGRVYTFKSVLLTQGKLKNGYLAVRLTLHSKSKTATVHSVVAAAFLGPRPDDQEVRHGPLGKLNNCVSNLS